MMAGLLWAGAILLAMGWFAIGWVARGHENRKYAESRDRHFERLAHTQALELDHAHAQRVYWESQRTQPATPPAVVYVQVASPAALPMWPAGAGGHPVLDGHVVTELPGARG